MASRTRGLVNPSNSLAGKRLEDSFNSGQRQIRKTTARKKMDRLRIDKAVLLLVVVEEVAVVDELLDGIINH